MIIAVLSRRLVILAREMIFSNNIVGEGLNRVETVLVAGPAPTINLGWQLDSLVDAGDGIFLGVLFYFPTRYVIEPWIEGVLQKPYYV